MLEEAISIILGICFFMESAYMVIVQKLLLKQWCINALDGLPFPAAPNQEWGMLLGSCLWDSLGILKYGLWLALQNDLLVDSLG